MFLVSILGFSCKPDIVVLSENILHIALWVKNPTWAQFVQGQAINSYHNIRRFVFFCVYHGVFWYVGNSGVVRKDFRHCIVGKRFKMTAICSRSNYKWTLFFTE